MAAYKILHAVGPGDVVAAYRRWSAKEDHLTETSRTYSGQFFDFCRVEGVQAWAVSSSTRRDLLIEGPFVVENRPKPLGSGRSGVLYHLNEIGYAFSLLFSALRYRADLALIDSGTTHWFALTLLRVIGVKVVANFHNVYCLNGLLPTSRVKKIVMMLDGLFFGRGVSAWIGVSPECERQMVALAGRQVPFFQYRAQFNDTDFSDLGRSRHDNRPFRVLFVGRVERNKGVFDLVEIAEKLAVRRAGSVRFDVCGGGASLDDLRRQINARGLDEVIHVHGRLSRPALLPMYAASHMVIVPTRGDFCEGMPKVCAEAVLARRPVLTSRLSNALDVLEGAIIEARPEDTDDYVAQIERILDDPVAYRNAVEACEGVRSQFVDTHFGIQAALQRMYQLLRAP